MSGLISSGDRSRINLMLRVESCLDDPQEDLLVYYREDNIRCFVDCLNEDSVDVNKAYSQEQERTLLQISVEEGKDEFVRELLRRKDIDPNQTNKVSKKTALHSAVEKGYEAIVQLLIDGGGDVNAKLENGNTPLHIAAHRCAASWVTGNQQKELQNKFSNIVRILLRSNICQDAENNIGLTPLFLAAEKGTTEVVRLLLRRGCCVTVEVDDETVEDLIKQNHPSIKKEEILPSNRRTNNTIETRLFKALYQELSSHGSFINLADKIKEKVDWDSTNGGFTFLQYACEHGYQQIVEYLLDVGCDPNGVCPNNPVPPIVIAGHHGYHRIIKVFKKRYLDRGSLVEFSATDNHIKRENVLHKVLKAESKTNINREFRDYTECLKILLLDENKDYKNNIAPAINGQDNLGNTPLHIAAQVGNNDAVRKLLRCGANIGLKNYKGDTPVLHIPPTIMEEFLDDCLAGEGQITDSEFKLTFKYSFLGPPPIRYYAIDKQPLLQEKEEPSKDLPETEPLWYMSSIREHRHLLSHPVITSFLWMKWRRIRPYFYMNVVLYSIFVCVVTSYILLLNTQMELNSVSGNRTDEQGRTIKLTTGQNNNNNRSNLALSTSVMRWLTLLLLIPLSLRELFQVCISVRRYFLNFENLAELLLIGLTFYISLEPGTRAASKHISGIIILVSWTEFVLLIGRHPRLSTYISMFNRVSNNFIRFLTWYAMFIISFGICFFIILHRPETEVDENGEQVNEYWANPADSIFKTIVMSLTGEIEFEDIKFSLDLGKVMFLLWVFFIMLVLVNLLNGLAVSDISIIQREAVIGSIVSRVSMITYIESILLGDPFSFLNNFPEAKIAQRLPSCNIFSSLYRFNVLRWFFSLCGSKRILLFASRLRDKQAVFRPNKSLKEKSGHYDDLVLSDEILEEAKGLLVKKNTITEGEELKERLTRIEKTLLLLSKQQNHIIQTLHK